MSLQLRVRLERHLGCAALSIGAPLRYVVLGGLLRAAVVDAQFNGTLAAVSDYRFRGISLSDEGPAAQLSVAYDGPGGGYGGLFVSTVRFATSATTAQVLGFLGIAKSIGDSVHADAGVDYSVFGGTLRDYDYGEIYAGLSSARWSAHIHYSPDYFNIPRASLYGDFDATHPIGERIALLAHVGVLAPGKHRVPASVRAPNYPVDVRAGVGLDAGGFNFQFAWVATNATSATYPIDNRQRAGTAVVSVARAF